MQPGVHGTHLPSFGLELLLLLEMMMTKEDRKRVGNCSGASEALGLGNGCQR